MKAAIYLSDGGVLDFEDFDEGSALDLREALADTSGTFLTFDMDGSTVFVHRDHIVRIDFETGDQA